MECARVDQALTDGKITATYAATLSGDTDIGHQQDLFQRLRRVDVDFPGAGLRCVGQTDDVVESILEVLRGALQALF